MRSFRRFQSLIVCLSFTGAGVAWAEDTTASRPTADFYIDSPFAPHRTWGSTARVGTSVGFLYNEVVDVTALGADTAIGYRLGRIAFEAEYQYLGFQVRGPDSTPLGNGQRLSLMTRLDVLRLGSRVVGENSMVALYVEGGVGTAWNHWYKPAYGEASRIVPNDTQRVEGQAGFGIYIDHRLQEPIGFPHRVAWFLGWRVAMSPHQDMTAAVCRGVSCKPIMMEPSDRVIDRSMLFQSSMQFTF